MKAGTYIRLMLIALLMLKTYHTTAQIMDTVCAGVHGEVYHVKPEAGSTYYWSCAGGVITSPNPADSVVVDWPAKSGVYTLTVTEVTKHGCPGDPIVAKVLVIDGLHVSVNGPGIICRGESVTLSATGATHYRWNTGQTGPQIKVQPQDTTTYTVIGYDGGCKPDSASIRVRVLQKPTAQFTYNPEKPVVDEHIAFHFMGKGADDWYWYFEDGKTSAENVLDPEYTFKEPGEKIVMLVAKNKVGCSDTIRYRLVVNLESRIFVPTAFTPNDDTRNELFKPVFLGMANLRMEIFNRWGERIFETEDINGGWDGTYKGAPCPEGVYLYVIKAQDDNKKWYYLDGNVTLLR